MTKKCCLGTHSTDLSFAFSQITADRTTASSKQTGTHQKETNPKGLHANAWQNARQARLPRPTDPSGADRRRRIGMCFRFRAKAPHGRGPIAFAFQSGGIWPEIHPPPRPGKQSPADWWYHSDGIKWSSHTYVWGTVGVYVGCVGGGVVWGR